MGGRGQVVRGRFVLLLVVAAAGLAVVPRARAQANGGNGIYTFAVVRDGMYTVGTGASYPSVPGVNVFWGAGNLPNPVPGSTWNSLRSYVTNSEYVLYTASETPSTNFQCYAPSDLIDPANPPNPPVATVETLPTGAVPPTGVRLTWHLVNAADDFNVIEEIDVVGTTVSDSMVKVTTSVRNNSAAQALIGIRYLWDWCIGGNNTPTGAQDGPYFGPRPPDPPTEPLLGLETDFPNPTFESYQASDSDSPSVTPPTLLIGGTSLGPASLVPPPTPPDLVKYAKWDTLRTTCFDAAVTGAQAGGVDAAVAYYWGPDVGTAKAIASGATYTVVQYVYGSFTPPPPVCHVTARLTGGGACSQPSVTLDASGSVMQNCASNALEYRFLDPTGLEVQPFGPGNTYGATASGNWSVEVRCVGDTTCTDTASAPVLLETPPTGSFPISVTDVDPCAAGLQVDWSQAVSGVDWSAAASWGTNGIGTFSVFRSTVSCADAVADPLNSPALVTDLTTTSWLDTSVTGSVPYYYVVRAEAQGPAQSCTPAPQPSRGAPFADGCLASPVADPGAVAPPSDIDAALRVSKDASGNALLHWETAPALHPGDTDVVTSSTLDRVARTETKTDLTSAPPPLTAMQWTDTVTTTPIVYYRVFRENACGQRSTD